MYLLLTVSLVVGYSPDFFSTKEVGMNIVGHFLTLLVMAISEKNENVSQAHPASGIPQICASPKGIFGVAPGSHIVVALCQIIPHTGASGGAQLTPSP